MSSYCCCEKWSPVAAAHGTYVLWMPCDEMLYQGMKSEQGGIVDWGLCRFQGMRRNDRSPGLIIVVDPEPSRKMWLVRIKQTSHPILDARRHILELRMPDP